MKIHNLESLGKFLKKTRKKKKITQLKLAKVALVSRKSIHNIESGRDFNIQTLLQIMVALELEFYVKSA